VFVLVNAAWVLAVAALAFVWTVVPALVVLAPLLALPTAVLTRLAVAAAREEAPSWRIAGAELWRHAGRKVLVAAVQLLLTLVAVVNLSVSVTIGGLAGVLTGLVAAYAALLVSAYALVLWPMLADPRRHGSRLRDELRVATVVLLTRTPALAVLLVIAVLAAIVAFQLIVPALILPSLVLLAVAGYVVPQVDRLSPPRAA
jgi:hypothetical protein